MIKGNMLNFKQLHLSIYCQLQKGGNKKKINGLKNSHIIHQ